MGGQVWNPDPWHNDVTGVIDHEGEVPFPDFRGPSDEGIAGCGLPCGGREAEHGQWAPVAVMHRVTHLCTDKGLVAEITIAGDEFIPEAAGRTAGTGDLYETERTTTEPPSPSIRAGWTRVAARP